MSDMFVYGIAVSKDDERYESFLNELKSNEEGLIFDLHEEWYGLMGYIMPEDQVVIGCCEDDMEEVLRMFDEHPYEDEIRKFLGKDYTNSNLKVYRFI